MRKWMRRNLHPNWHVHLIVLAFWIWLGWEVFYGKR